MTLIILVCCLCLTWHVAIGLPTLHADCSNKAADVVFILDSSNSIWRRNFTKQIAFVSDVVKLFDIGPGSTQTRVGVLTFGHQVWPKFDLKDKMDADSLVQSVLSIKHDRGTRTNTGDAIMYALEHMFTADAGHRRGVTRIAVVITDGRSQDTRATTKAAIQAHKAGIKTFAIGVGKYIDRKELEVIASSPKDEYLFGVDDFGALATIRFSLAQKTCDVTQPAVSPTTTTTTTTATTTIVAHNPPSDQSLKNCGGKPADVFFLVDSSGSIIRKDFNKEVQFVQSVVKMFDIASDKTRVGLISFSHTAKLVLPLDNSLNKKQLMDRISNMDHIGGGTDTAEALRMVRQDGFRKEIRRPGVAQIVIVLTDGLSANEDLTFREAKLTQSADIKIFAIGIGHGVDLIEVKNIASNPDDNFVFQVNDFNSLETIKDVLAIKTCKVAPVDVKDKPNDQPKCLVKKDTDMMFVYDTAALGPAKSDAISQFIATVVSKLDISSGILHIGRVTDNCPTGGNFQLSNRLSSADFTSIGLSSYSNLIKKVRRAGFTSEYGGRDSASNAAVLFVDSDMNGLDHAALREAKSLMGSSTVFVIAIGKGEMINDFSRSFGDSYYMHVDSYKDLSSESNTFLTKLCYFYTVDYYDYDIDYVVPV